ncbi:MAG: hypothetical protein MUO26_07625 [Methanotrichaceae archaeon]|nr:hypothetical protein [Methanotrichaceae archaeon]
MNYKFLAMTLIVALTLSLSGYGQKTIQTEPKQIDYLGEGLGWMEIPSTEHTAEYLAKVGGVAGDPLAITSENVKGNWTLELRDLQNRPVGKINLELFQIGTVVYGSGSTTDGLIATADGAIVDNTINLDVVTVPRIALYQLKKLELSGNTAGGSFIAYSPVGYMGGNVYAEKDVPKTLS